MTRSETSQKPIQNKPTNRVAKVEQAQLTNPPVGLERHTLGESLERFGWDIFGVVLIAGGIILLLGVLKLTRGSLIDSIINNL